VTWVLALAGLAAGTWGVSDFIAGLLSHRLPVMTILIGSKVAGMLLALLVVAARAVAPPDDLRLLLGVAAGLVGLPAVGFLLRAMRDGSLAVVAPIAAVAALIPVGWGLLRGERFGLGAALGFGVALVGVTLASWPVETGRRRRIRQSANLCALAAAIGFGTYFVLLHEASAADQYWATAVARISGGAGALILAAGLRRRGDASSPSGIRWPGLALAAPVFAVGAFDAVGDAAFAVGAAAGSLGLAAIVASMYPAVTVLLNRSLRRERMHTVHLYGVLATLFAVACLAW
jgi:drug/metabolite transporter (DMT)-like permease